MFSSLMSNFDTAREALETSLTSSGSAMAEHAKWSESLEARLNKLKATWQSLSQTFMNSDFLKSGIDIIIGLVSALDKLIDSFGTLGTIGLGAGIFEMFKHKNGISFIFKELSAFGSLVSEVWKSGGKLSTRFKDIGEAASVAGGSIGGKLLGSMSGMVGAIGLVVSAIGLVYNSYKKAKEAAAESRQEVIATSNAFLDSANTFEKAYIKYADRTDLTTEEEAELESAIKGTVDALDDKSSALHSIVNSSNDYLASLESIKKAELDAAKRAAEDKKEKAEEALREAAVGWESFDGSEVNIKLHTADKEAQRIAKEMGSEFVEAQTVSIARSPQAVEDVTLRLSGEATTEEIIKYYNFLQDYKNELKAAADDGLDVSNAYEQVNAVIEKMSESIGVYVDGTYEAVKASHQLANGIPKTTEAYVAMREAILTDEQLSNFSLDKKMTILNSLDSEYAQLFDLSSAEVQARKFVGIIKGYGNGSIDGIDEIGTVETFLNMRTAVNNNECTVGEYLSELNNVASISEDFSEKEKEEFNLAFGLDTDTIKEQYEHVYNYIKRNYIDNIKVSSFSNSTSWRHAKSIETTRIQELLDGLSASELSALISIKGEIDWEKTNNEDILKQIKEQAKLEEALAFKADFEVDTTALEALNEILAESASAIGLSEESIDSLKSKYKDLDGYNPATLFEATANGVKVNRDELVKLEKEYNNLTKTEVAKHLETLAGEYNDVTAEIDKCTNAGERAELIAKRDAYADKIEELATYQAQLEGVTGAYQRWIDAQNTPEDYEGYQAVATSREDIEDEISRGFISNATKGYIDLLSGEDLVGGTIDDYAEAWAKLDEKVGSTSYSIHDFFTVNDDGEITATGIDRFFDGLQQDFKGSVAEFNKETGQWEYDFSQENLQKIQDEWGIGIEAIELLLEAAASAGYDVDWSGILDNLDLDTSSFETLVSVAEKAQSELNKLEGYENLDFNFTTTGVTEATTEVEKARKIYNDLIYKDGKLNLEAEGAEQMQVVLTTLLVQKQQLSTPAIMKVDTSQIDQAKTDVIDVIEQAKVLQTAYENYEIAITTGVDVESAKTDLNEAIKGMQGTSVDVRAKLQLPTDADLEAAKYSIGDIKVGASLDDTSIGLIATKIQTQCTPEVIAKVTDLDETAIQDGSQKVVYTADHKDVDDFINSLTDISKKIIYTYATEGTKPNPSDINRNIIYKFKTEGKRPKADGTANADGTTQSSRAFARGDWGIKGSGTALVGELGMETLVRGGRFYTIGDNGAEFIKYQQGDIIFNHKQTEELFKNGKVTSDGGRGRMYVNGSAFVDGSYPSTGYAFWEASATTSKFASLRGATKKKPKTKVKTTTDKNSVNTSVTTNFGGATVTGSEFAKQESREELQKKFAEKHSSKNDNTDKFEESFDWVEIAISRIERAINKLDQKANNIYKNWTSRNEALKDEIGKVEEEINLQQSAYNRYIKAANSVGLSESYAKKVRNGTIDIEDFAGEADGKLVEKIKEYQQWYEKALACQDAIDELKEKEASLYSQHFNNVSEKYNDILQAYEHTESMLNEYINQSEAQGHIVSKNYYNALIDNEENRISKLKEEQAALVKARDDAVANDEFDKYSEDWYKMCSEIDSVTQSIESGTTSLIEYNKALQDIDWEIFDLTQERISDIAAEADFLIELMSNEKLFDDNGRFTEQGVATAGLHAQNYNTYMYQADDYGAKVADIDKKIASGELDGYSKDVVDKRREYIEQQREMILNAEQEKEAIRDLISEGIELELDALDERIQKYKDALDAQKDLYDYQKRVEEQTKEISSLQKQLSAYEGDNSEEAQAKIQELRVSLEEAEADLEETEYDKYITDQQKLLDTLYTEYESLLNERLDNTDYLISQVVDGINTASTLSSEQNAALLESLGEGGTIANALGVEGAIASAIVNAVGENGSIKSILNKETTSVGATLSGKMNEIWTTEGTGTNSVLANYGQGFQDKQTTTNSALNSIKTDVDAMVNAINKDAEKKVTQPKTPSSANANPVKNANNGKSNADKDKSGTKTLTEDKLTGIAASIWIYGESAGWGNNPVRSGKLTQKFGLETAQKVQSIINAKGANGELYKFWLNKNKNLDAYKYNAFKLGAKNIDESQLAWTQENGQEFIVRPSDGAILTPIAKDDSILNSVASNNIWKMANSPTDFIRDNLGIGTSNVPNNSNVQSNYTQNFDKVVFNFPNVKNYDEMLAAMQKDPNFDRLIESMSIGKLAGKSSLSKGKAIR